MISCLGLEKPEKSLPPARSTATLPVDPEFAPYLEKSNILPIPMLSFLYGPI